VHDTPQPHVVRFIDSGDALAPLAREALVQAGCTLADDAPIVVLGDGSLDAVRSRVAGLGPPDLLPTLALNTAALALLEQDGARLERLAAPQFARALDCVAVSGAPLEALGGFQAGIYCMHRIAATALPAGWVAAATGADGRVIAALNPARRCVALLFRPDAALSLHRNAGPRALAAALAWLARKPQ
jgi:hypothetical protein